MKITIKLFALGKELVGASELAREYPTAVTVQTVMEDLKREHPRFAQLKSYLVAVNMEYADGNRELTDGDEVAIIPPVSGG